MFATMKAKREVLEPFVDKWIIPLSKEFSNKDELLSIIPTNCEVRFARLTNRTWVLVRKLTKEDLNSLDFIKYLTSINLPRFKSTIVKIVKI